MGFELATSMAVEKQSIHYATNSPCDWVVHVIKCMHFSKNSELKITLLLVNIIVNTECQHTQNSAVGLYQEVLLELYANVYASCVLKPQLIETVILFYGSIKSCVNYF